MLPSDTVQYTDVTKAYSSTVFCVCLCSAFWDTLEKGKKIIRAACMKSETLCLEAHLTMTNVLPNGTSQTVNRALATSMNFNDVKKNCRNNWTI